MHRPDNFFLRLLQNNFLNSMPTQFASIFEASKLRFKSMLVLVIRTKVRGIAVQPITYIFKDKLRYFHDLPKHFILLLRVMLNPILLRILLIDKI